MTITAGDVVALALTKVGFRYSQGPTRTTGQDGYFDCSGFTYFLLEHLGIRPPGWEAQSHLQALYDRDHGLLLPVEKAIVTVGALLYEGPQHAYVGGAGIPGHVAVSLGNGHTVEAMGHAWGTCIGNAFGRGWSNAGLFPNVDYATAVPTPPHPAPGPGPQLEGDTMSIVIPSRAKVGHDGREAYFNLNMQDDNVIAYNGAQLKWRMPAGQKQPKSVAFGEALVYDIPIKGPFIGMVEDVGPVDVAGQVVYVPNNVLAVTSGDGGIAFADIVL